MTIESITHLGHAPAVYNIEVHAEHVYRVADVGVLVHNACPTDAEPLLGAAKNFWTKQSHAARAKQLLEELLGQKLQFKLKSPEGLQELIDGWSEFIRNGTLKPKGWFLDDARLDQTPFEVFEGAGYTLLRDIDGNLRSVMRSDYDFLKHISPFQIII